MIIIITMLGPWLMHAAGASVLTCGRSADELSACLSEWRSKGFDVTTCVADVSTEEGRGVLVQEAGTLFGDQLHCLVNSAGYYSATDYEKQFQTNLDSAFFLCKSFHPLLKLAAAAVVGSSSSSIVNIGSVSGTVPRADDIDHMV